MFIITSIAQRHCVFHAGRWRRLAEVKRNETEMLCAPVGMMKMLSTV